MTQKERLYYMIQKCIGRVGDDRHDESLELADYLLSNGVLVPPCKVGDKVYVIFGKQHIYEGLVTGLRLDAKDDAEIEIDHFGGRRESCIGTTVFFTRKETEQVLKERYQNVSKRTIG